jgi:UDP-N-acetylmuramoylalanine--D-glutamate ligase
MIAVSTFAGRSVAVFGLGRSGLATCRALNAGGAQVAAFDDDSQKVAAATAAGIKTADLRTLDWSTLAALVLSPGVPLTHPSPHWTVDLAHAHGVAIIGDIELYCGERRARAPVGPFVAVTGTNGKSTTTALVTHLLTASGMSAEAGGNIGTAILSLEPPRPGHAHVVECSSYQIDLTPSLDPTVGILLNISPDHLDRHGSLAHYAAVKARLVESVEPGGTAIVGVDDAWCRQIADEIERTGAHLERVAVGRPLARGLYVDANRTLWAAHAGKERRIVDLNGIGALRGAHNAQNAACATAAALALGIGADAIAGALNTFPGLAHRMEQVGRKDAVLFVNDSKATNADAAARALASFDDIFWIAGGVPKAGGIADLAPYFARIRKAYLIGEAAKDFASTLSDRVPHVLAGTLERAVALAAEDALASRLRAPVVLLSPACASFDQFPNFEVRGDAFREHVCRVVGVTAGKTANEKTGARTGRQG